MGLLADSKRKQQEKYNKQFISMYDSVLYLGEPLKEALEFIIQNMQKQSILNLTPNGFEKVFTYDNGFRSDFNEYNWEYWFENGYDDVEQTNTKEIVKELTNCINKGEITPQSPIYNLGFGKKRFLEFLSSVGVDIPNDEIETAQSPDISFDDEIHFDMDYYTFQAIINERDELREKIENLSNDYPVNIELQAENDRLKAEIERLTTELNKKPTTPTKEGQGDSLLILGAVMDCLDNETIRNYSQTVLIGKIREKYPNVTGLSESTISKKISESKKYLQKHK